MLRYKKN